MLPTSAVIVVHSVANDKLKTHSLRRQNIRKISILLQSGWFEVLKIVILVCMFCSEPMKNGHFFVSKLFLPFFVSL